MNSNHLIATDGCSHILRELKTFIYKFTIHNATGGHCINEIIQSSAFELDLPNNKITGQLFLRGFADQHYTSCEVQLNSGCKVSNLRMKLSLLDNENKQYKFGDRVVESGGKYEQFALIPNSVKKEESENYENLIKQNTLTILCEISVFYITKSSFSKNLDFEITESRLKHDVDLMESKMHWDVTLVVQEHKFYAHKCILASRCKVFAAMFGHEIEKTKYNKVNITDIDKEVFEEMLRYIYTGKVLKLKEMAAELLVASDKYDLQYLKYMCEKELADNLKVETVLEILILADLCKSQLLKTIAMHFIKVKKQAVSKTEGWSKFANDYSLLLAELYLLT